MVVIIPTVFAKNEQEFTERFKMVTSLAQQIQIDFMDGKLHRVKGIMPSVVPNLKRRKQLFEAHMMVAHPERWVQRTAEKGFDKFLFHIESQSSKDETVHLINRIKEAGMKPGIVINPSTSLERIKPFLDDVALVMFMGHEPGVEGVGVEADVYKNIRRTRKEHPQLVIEVDGGVDDKTAPRFVKAGATRLSVGSYISRSVHPRQAVTELRRVTRGITQ